MKKTLLILLLITAAINVKAQNFTQAWYAFENMSAKVLYVTAVSRVDLGPSDDQWQTFNYEAGFIESNYYLSHHKNEIHYASNMEFFAYDSDFKAMLVEKRQKMIDRCRQDGYQIINIAMPTPIKRHGYATTGGHGSQQ